MPQTTPLAVPIATLEIRDGHLPARMVAGRLRADLSPSSTLARVPSRRRLRLAMLLLVFAAPLLGVTRRSRSAA